MKQIFIIIITLLISTPILLAQPKVRKDIRKGNEAYKQQLYNTAEANYKSALEANPKSTEANFNLGNVFYKEEKWDDALKAYQQYLSLETIDKTKMGDAWYNVGNTLLQKNELKQSMEAYKKALRLNPNNDDARYNLATVQKILKDQQDNQKDNKDQNKDQDKDKKDQDKDKDKNKDQDKDNKDQNKDQNKDKNKDQNKDKKDQQDQQQPQMSQENIQQLLKAIEQDEKETQDKVQRIKAADRKQQNENNRRLNKDW